MIKGYAADAETSRKDVVAKREYNNDGDGESEGETLFPLGLTGAWRGPILVGAGHN